MAKGSPKKPRATDTRTPFQKFDALAKRVIRVPKTKAGGRNGKR